MKAVALRRQHRPVGLAAGLLAATLTVVAPPFIASAGAQDRSASTGWSSLTDLGVAAPSEQQRTQSVIRYSTEGTVRSFETVASDGSDVVIDLASDILFDTDEAVLPPGADLRIVELLTDVAPGTAVAVHGHTDTVGSDEYNLDLSRRRAEAVAAAVRAARPDLVLDVQGFGETRLKVAEGGTDTADDRAANRRVELRYRS